MDDKSNGVSGILKTLWDLENELRSAARNGIIMRGDEARRHLAEARRLLEEVSGSTLTNTSTDADATNAPYVTPTDKH